MYKGEFVSGLEHGLGVKTHPSVGTCSGEWRKGRMHGKGVLKHLDGTTFQGHFISGVPHEKRSQPPAVLLLPQAPVGVWPLIVAKIRSMV
mmetsp:Transcript_8714/g.21791  ORF Transcript_8714/g.21791 Transcript_8714/m.21791 type:complete len:90 (+) Transcript_8714:218-487(+)